MVDGVLYAPNAVGLVRALDPGSGETRWEQTPFAQTIEEVSRPSPRGVDYWKSGNEERLFLVRGEYLYAMDARDGRTSRTSATGPRPPALEPPAGRPLQLDRRPDRRQRRDHRRRRHRRRRRRRREAGGRPRRRARLRRPHRQAAVDVPRRAADRRVRRRHLGRRVERLLGRSGVVVLHLGRRRAGPGLRAAVGADRHQLRRPSPRRQPLLRLDRRARREDRQARVALPDRPPRPLGLRHRGPGHARRHHRERQAHQGADAAEQDRLHLRLRPRQRHAGVAD